jgi:cell division protein ZapA
MADVQLNIAGREYVVTCRDGEEAHLMSLAAVVDAKAREAGASGGLNESRLLLFAGLLLADELHEQKTKRSGNTSSAAPDTNSPSTPQAPSALSDAEAERVAATLEKLTDRIERLAAGLE